MSVSIDEDPAGGESGQEDARAVLTSWLDDYVAGRCERADMEASFLSLCRQNPEAPWDALALVLVSGAGMLAGSVVLDLEDTGSRMTRLGKGELLYERPLTVDELLTRVGRVELAQVREVAEDLLSAPMSLAAVGMTRWLSSTRRSWFTRTEPSHLSVSSSSPVKSSDRPSKHCIAGVVTALGGVVALLTVRTTSPVRPTTQPAVDHACQDAGVVEGVLPRYMAADSSSPRSLY